MNKSINKVILIGRTGKDIELKYSAAGLAICNFSIATTFKYKDQNGEYKERTDWHKIAAFGKLAEICSEYIKKGDLAYYEGRLQTKEWNDGDIKKYITEVILNQVLFLDFKKVANTDTDIPF